MNRHRVAALVGTGAMVMSIIQLAVAEVPDPFVAAGAKLVGNSTARVAWDLQSLGPRVRVELWRPSIGRWTLLYVAESQRGEWRWTVPNASEAGCRIRMISISSPELHQVIPGYFEVVRSAERHADDASQEQDRAINLR